MEEYKIAMEGWKKGEEMRRAENVARHKEWEQEVQTWKQSPKPRGKQPLLGKLKKVQSKPTYPTNVVADEDQVSPPPGRFASDCLTKRNRMLPMRVTVMRDTSHITLLRGVVRRGFGAILVRMVWGR